MRFRFEATTPALDHGIGNRLNAQARNCIAPDMAVWSVEVLGPWKHDGSQWVAEAEAFVSDGRDLRDLLATGSDKTRINGPGDLT